MNYIELINGFWSKSRTDDLKAIDVSTYMSILDYCNSLGWLNPFICHWDIVCQRSKTSKNAFYSSVERLNELGYIKFEKGNRSTKQPKLTVLQLENKEGTRKEHVGNTEGTRKDHAGNLIKHINYKTIKLIEDNASLVEDNLETWIKDSKKIEVDENDTCLSFDDFWDMYDLKRGIENCKKKYSKISEEDRKLIKETLPLYVASTAKTKTENNGKMFRKNPHTYLNQKCWNDEIIGFETEVKPKKGDTMNIWDIMRKQAEEEKRQEL